MIRLEDVPVKFYAIYSKVTNRAANSHRSTKAGVGSKFEIKCAPIWDIDSPTLTSTYLISMHGFQRHETN